MKYIINGLALVPLFFVGCASADRQASRDQEMARSAIAQTVTSDSRPEEVRGRETLERRETTDRRDAAAPNERSLDRSADMSMDDVSRPDSGGETAAPLAAGSERNAVRANDSTFVAEIRFPKGSSELSFDAKQRLNDVVAQAERSGRVNDIKVIGWSDFEYPSPAAGTLSSDQRRLAGARNRAISDYLKAQYSGIGVDTVNMADRPNVFSRMFRTSDARIKRALEDAGIPNTESAVKDPSKASKAMVVVLLR